MKPVGLGQRPKLLRFFKCNRGVTRVPVEQKHPGGKSEQVHRLRIGFDRVDENLLNRQVILPRERTLGLLFLRVGERRFLQLFKDRHGVLPARRRLLRAGSERG